ncbi:T9SS type A sorting domain-containing protein [uncultured Imperialibacter sp.]|uniref:T9SS type A sorting domain-containing protein n=1 Tax=uncultured Imperialibacter sp. TaxID=1672639 RepID=UPI0030D73CA8
MKRLLSILGLICCAQFGLAQAPQIAAMEYYVDADPGFGGGTSVFFTPGAQVDFNFTVPTGSLTPGMHTLYVRSMDENNVWSHFERRAFFISQSTTETRNNIVSMEYYLDSDPGQGNGTPVAVTPSADVDVFELIPTAFLSSGFHNIYFRVQDASGQWSAAEHRPFFVSQSTSEVRNDIDAVEYFIDVDPGHGNGVAVAVTPSTDADLIEQIPTSSLSAGFHTVYFRVRDASGQWSATEHRPFFLSQSTSEVRNDIDAVEYFIDVDPGQGNGVAVAVTPSTDADLIEQIPTSSLSAGFHTVYFRVRDASGQWSATEHRPFFISQSTSEVRNDIDAVEYFIDVDPGQGNGVAVAVTSSTDVDLMEQIPTTSLSTGFHTVYFRVRDASGQWSATERKPFFITTSSVEGQNTITSLEYFFDVDPGHGNGLALAISPGTQVDAAVPIPIGSLSPGMHTLHIRALDDRGQWSHIESRPFFRDGTRLITTVEYAIDTDPGVGQATQVVVASPQNPIDENVSIPIAVNSLSSGSHNLLTRVKDGNGAWSLTNTTAFELLSFSLMIDSVALDSIYRKTAGASWVNSANWYNVDLNTWYGIDTLGGRVQAVSLGSNNLEGGFPYELAYLSEAVSIDLSGNSLTDSVPEQIVNLQALTSFNISNNELTHLPDMSSLGLLSSFDVSNNRFTFEDLEPNVGIITVNAGQKPFGLSQTIGLNAGDNQTLAFAVGGISNEYQWEKDGEAIVGATSDTYEIANFGPLDLGVYKLRVTNSVVTELTLISEPITITSPASVLSITTNDINPNNFSSVSWIVAFDQPVTGVSEANFSLVESGVDSPVLTAVSDVDGVNWLVAAEFGVAGGTLGLDFTNNADVLPGVISIPFTGEVYSIDNIPATADTVIVQSGPVNLDSQLLNFDILNGEIGATFEYFINSEADSSALTISGSDTISSDPERLTEIDLANLADGIFSVKVVLTDSLGNRGDTISTEGLKDIVPPTATLTYSLPQPSITGVIPVDIQFSEAVTNLTSQDFEVLNGVVDTIVQTNASNYQLILLVNADIALLQVSLQPTGVTDLAENLAENSSVLKIRKIKDGVIASDSLALVSLYNALDGANWVNNTNWLAPGQKVENWFGVTASLSRITGIDLAANGLRGVLPNDILVLDSLKILDVSNNQISRLPNLTSMTLSTTNVASNVLDFASLEFNMGLASFTFSPQSALLTFMDTLQERGESLILVRQVGGSANNYQWFKNDLSLEGASGFNHTIDFPTFADEGNYYVEVTSSIVPGLTLTTKPVALRVSSLERDRLLLGELYSLTSGDNWINNSGWNTADLSSWFGITVASDRVTGIDLPANNLSGDLPKFLGDMRKLTSIDLSENEITSLPVLTNIIQLTMLNVSNNRLQFDDLEPNINIPSLIYSPQKLAGVMLEELVPVGADYLLSVSIGGSANSYQWFRNGVEVEEGNAAEYTIAGIDFATMGDYQLEVTNSKVAGLTIQSNVQRVLATASLAGRITDKSELPVNDAFGALLIVKAGAYDTTGHFRSGPNGTFVIEEVVLDDYLLFAEQDIEVFLPSFYKSTIDWAFADLLQLRGNVGELVLTMEGVLPVLTPADGDNTFSGLFESDFGDDGGRVFDRKRVKGAGVSLSRSRFRAKDNDEGYELIAYVQTDETGQFEMTNLPDGDYRVNIQYPGIPMDPTSFIEFQLGGGNGVEQNSIRINALATPTKIVVTKVEETGIYLDYFKGLTVYPNPANRFLTIRYEKLVRGEVVADLIDLTGQTIRSANLEQGSDRQVLLDVDDVKAGIYILRFHDTTGNGGSVISLRIKISR